MFNSLTEYTNELQDSIEYTQAFLKKLRGGRTRLVNSIAKSEEAVKLIRNENRYVSGIKEQFVKIARGAAKDIMHGNMVQAFRENYEFDAPPYRQGLLEAIEDDETYLVRATGAGFNSVIRVDINLNKTAGTLNMWSSAVKAYRRELKTRVPRKNSRRYEDSALRASRAWAGIFSRRAGTSSKFMQTIRKRLSYSAKPAPFWSIVNFGSPPGMASDRGGYPTPKNKETNFVSEAEQAVNEYLANLFAKEKEKYLQLFNNYQVILDDSYARLQELDDLVSQIRLDLQHIKELDRKSERIFRNNNISKLEKAVQLIRDGLVSNKSLQLAVKGSYRGKRLTAEKVKELIY